jgi:hypothetical protein
MFSLVFLGVQPLIAILNLVRGWTHYINVNGSTSHYIYIVHHTIEKYSAVDRTTIFVSLSHQARETTCEIHHE